MLADLSEQVRRNTLGTFRDYDANRDGILSRVEVEQALKVAIHWYRSDHNKDGSLTFAELSHFFASQERARNNRRAREQEYLTNLFRSHPPTEDRVRALLQG